MSQSDPLVPAADRKDLSDSMGRAFEFSRICLELEYLVKRMCNTHHYNKAVDASAPGPVTRYVTVWPTDESKGCTSVGSPPGLFMQNQHFARFHRVLC